MTQSKSIYCGMLTALAVAGIVGIFVSNCRAQERRGRDQLTEPVYRITKANPAKQNTAAQGPEHPLAPALRVAYSSRDSLEKVTDYTAQVVKRENVNGVVSEHQYFFLKVRHEQKDAQGNVTIPLSAYLKFIGPKPVIGREVLWIQGQNGNKLIAHEGKGALSLIPGTWLDINGVLAMRGQRYPISKIGIKHLVDELIVKGERDAKQPPCEVKYFKKAMVAKRECTCLQITHKQQRAPFDFHIARIFIDDELNVPIRYAAWDFPRNRGDEPILMEEYTYTDLSLNPGLKDADFDPTNPDYDF